MKLASSRPPRPHPISTPKFQVPALGSAGIWSAMATSRGRSCGLEFRGSRINFHISSQERVKFSALKFRTEGFRGTWNHTAQLELQEELPSLKGYESLVILVGPQRWLHIATCRLTTLEMAPRWLVSLHNHAQGN